MMQASSGRAADYWTLTKPEVNLPLGVATAAGFCLAGGGLGHGLSITALMHTVVGTLLVASGTGTLNQLLERHFDALMRRTAGGPARFHRADLSIARVGFWSCSRHSGDPRARVGGEPIVERARIRHDGEL